MITGLDKFYLKIKRHILLAAGFTEDKSLAFIIKACRLKPYVLLFEEWNTKLVLHKHWIDEAGNSLKIVKNKRIKIILNHLLIDRKKIVSTDLYEGLSIEKVSSISKLAFILVGKEREIYKDHYICAFLGIDDYLRTFVFFDGEWKMYPSLYLGMRILRNIASNVDIKYFKELGQKDPVIYPCAKQQIWLSCWPPGADFASLARKWDNPISELIKKV